MTHLTTSSRTGGTVTAAMSFLQSHFVTAIDDLIRSVEQHSGHVFAKGSFGKVGGKSIALARDAALRATLSSRTSLLASGW